MREGGGGGGSGAHVTKEKWRRKWVKAAEIMVKTRERKRPEQELSNNHQMPTDRAVSVNPSST